MRIGLLTTRSHPLLPYLLDRLRADPAIHLAVICDRKDFSDRDRDLFAQRTGGALPLRAPDLSAVDCVDVDNHNGAEAVQFVRDRELDLLFNAGTPRRIQASLLKAARRGVVNVHPGILPTYRGASCCEWAIYRDEPVGVTAHFMDEGLDSGPIIFTRELSVVPGQTYPEVRTALYRLWIDASAEAVREVEARGLAPDRLPPQPPAAPFTPIPDALLTQVIEKLARGAYAPHRGDTA